MNAYEGQGTVSSLTVAWYGPDTMRVPAAVVARLGLTPRLVAASRNMQSGRSPVEVRGGDGKIYRAFVQSVTIDYSVNQ